MNSRNRSAAYNSWRSMRQRCVNPNHLRWLHYGGRGITVCAAWSSFAAFLRDMGERPAGKTLDRIDPNGDYEPANCRWATLSEQNRNKVKSRRRQAWQHCVCGWWLGHVPECRELVRDRTDALHVAAVGSTG